MSLKSTPHPPELCENLSLHIDVRGVFFMNLILDNERSALRLLTISSSYTWNSENDPWICFRSSNRFITFSRETSAACSGNIVHPWMYRRFQQTAQAHLRGIHQIRFYKKKTTWFDAAVSVSCEERGNGLWLPSPHCTVVNALG